MFFHLANNEVNVSLGGNTQKLLDNNINLKEVRSNQFIKTHPVAVLPLTQNKYRSWLVSPSP
jgi:hypothetical protein